MLIFSHSLDDLGVLWKRIEPTLHPNTLRALARRRSEVLASVTDPARNAAVIAANTARADPPTAERLAAPGSSGRSRNGPSQPIERLSQRERQVFDLVVWGSSNKQIAGRLGISVKTVETHRGHINGKLSVHTSADIVRLASLWGMLLPFVAPTKVESTQALSQ